MAILLSMAMLLPMFIGLAHSWHEHQEVICHAEHESHIHKKASDCDHLHFTYADAGEHSEEVRFDIPVAVSDRSALYTRNLPSKLTSNLPVRGPPVING